MTDTEPSPVPQDRDSGRRRGSLIAVAAVGTVIVVGLVVLASTSNLAESEDRVVLVSFDGDNCSVDGPIAVDEGQIEVAYENLSQQRVWAQIAVLDEGFDGRDLIATIGQPDGVGPPTWARGVWSVLSLDSGQTSSSIVEVHQGHHVVVCGTWTPEYRPYFGSEFRVRG